MAGDDQPGPPVGGGGIAYLRGSPAEGLLEQAKWVLDRAGNLAAILGVQGPAVRFSPRAMRTAVELLKEKAALISSAL